MKNYYLFLAIIIILSFNSCNEASYIEGQEVENTSTGNSVTFYCLTDVKLLCSGSISIYIDGDLQGTITELSSTEPNCGTKNNKAITISRPPGSYNCAVVLGASCPIDAFILNFQENCTLIPL